MACSLKRIRPLGLFRFRIYFLKRTNLLDSWQDFLDGGSARRKASTYTQGNTTQKNADTHPCLEWVSNPRSQCSSGRRQYVLQTGTNTQQHAMCISLTEETNT